MSVIGIDLGFQTCLIGVPRAGGIEVLLNEYSNRQTAACVSLCPKNRELGDAAQQKTITNFKNTLAEFKHFIGRDFKDEYVQKKLETMNAKSIALPDGSVGFTVQYLGEEKTYNVTQIVAMLLTKLRINAESELKTKVTDCCMGVPTTFNDRQRHALVAAAKLAGLEVKLINECTAVALAFGIYKKDLPEQNSDNKDVKPRKVIFVDVGHSQTQVSGVDFYKGKLEIKSVASDLVGGQDFDKELFEHFCAEFKEKKKLDVKSNPRAKIRLLAECQKLKKLMSANSTACPINIECLMNDTDVSGKMLRADFEEMSNAHFVRIESTCKKLLQQMKDNGSLKDIADIDSVQIVGGATRIPKIKAIISEVFGQECKTELNTDEAVARGAALRAAIYSPTLRVRDFAISDITMHSVKLSWKPAEGIEEGGDNSNDAEVFKQDGCMNIVKVLTFYRSEPFDLTAQYNDGANAHQSLIGNFRIEGVNANYEGKSNKVKAKIRFDENGCFSVEDANMVEKLPPVEEEEKKDDDKKDDKKEDKKDEAPAKKKAKTTKTTVVPVVVTKPNVLTSDQHNKLLEVELAMQSQDRAEREKSDAKNGLEEYIYGMRDKVQGGDYKDFIVEADAEVFCAKLTKYEDWLYDEGDDVSKSEYNAKLDDLEVVGKAVKNRYLEAELRPKAIDAFQTALVAARTFLSDKAAGAEKYAHITDDEVTKVSEAFAPKEKWFNDVNARQAAAKKSDDPIVTTKELQNNCVSFNAVVQPIFNKPIPKVEPPPVVEEEKKEEAPASEEKKEGEEEKKEGEAKEGEAKEGEATTTTETPAEDVKKPTDDMDID